MTHHAPSGIASARLAQRKERNHQVRTDSYLTITDAEQHEASRSLSHEGASSTTAFFAGCRQVFGLSGASFWKEFLVTSASQPNWASASLEVFVPVYRCGTVL